MDIQSTHVFIHSFIFADMDNAIDKASRIIKSCGPDGRKTQYALLEEFIDGDEFAINLIASPTTPRGVQVSWIIENRECFYCSSY